MKNFITTTATAVVSLCGIVFIAMKALELPLVLESLWGATNWVTFDPLLLCALMLFSIIVIGRTTDFLRSHIEHRQQVASRSEAIPA